MNSGHSGPPGESLDRHQVLELYDREMRLGPPDSPGCRVESVNGVVRVVGGNQPVILWQRLSAEEVPAAVAAQVAYFRTQNAPVEWKLFAHDPEIGLPGALAQAGFVPDAPETLLVFDLRWPVPTPPTIQGLEIRRVRDERMVQEMVDVDTAAFGAYDGSVREHADGRLDSPAVGLFVAYLDGVAVAGGRVEMPTGKSFASIWGGGTVPPHRGRGIYRTLVAHRAALARERGYRFLTVDATDATSKPILERLGFVALTAIQGWVWKPSTTDPPTVAR